MRLENLGELTVMMEFMRLSWKRVLSQDGLHSREIVLKLEETAWYWKAWVSLDGLSKLGEIVLHGRFL